MHRDAISLILANHFSSVKLYPHFSLYLCCYTREEIFPHTSVHAILNFIWSCAFALTDLHQTTKCSTTDRLLVKRDSVSITGSNIPVIPVHTLVVEGPPDEKCSFNAYCGACWAIERPKMDNLENRYALDTSAWNCQGSGLTKCVDSSSLSLDTLIFPAPQLGRVILQLLHHWGFCH